MTFLPRRASRWGCRHLFPLTLSVHLHRDHRLQELLARHIASRVHTVYQVSLGQVEGDASRLLLDVYSGSPMVLSVGIKPPEAGAWSPVSLVEEPSMVTAFCESMAGKSFTRQVLWKLLKVVKFGEVISYQQLAALAGNPKAARAVGGAMRNNPVPILIPCHRVICSSGAVGNYSGGLVVKEWLLVHEGHRAGKPGLGGSSGLAGAWLKRAGATSGSLPAGRD
ncbi:hypothetical protein H8959_011130 [Pygathrix nigripes]